MGRRRKQQLAAGGGAAAPTTPTVWSALRQAVEALDGGKRREALELADQTCLRYATDPLAHLVRSAVYNRARSCTGEFDEKLRLLQISVESSAQAAALSPSSINLLLLNASLMYNTINFTGGDRTYVVCREVDQVCVRAFSITNPAVFRNDLTPKAALLLNLTTDMELIRESLRTLQGDAEAICRQLMPSSTFSSFQHQLIECKDKSHKLYHVSIQDLEAAAAANESSVDGHRAQLLKEALAFAEAERTFVMWVCCCCNEKFSTSNALAGHVMEQHVGILSPELQTALPQPAPSDWIRRSLNWHPLDATTLERLNTYSKERSDLLEKISRKVKMLVDHGILTTSHVNEMVKYAMTAIHRLPNAACFLLQGVGVDEWNACICIVDTPRLTMIIAILDCIFKSIGLDKFHEGDHSHVSRERQFQEKLILDNNHVILSLDDSAARGNLTSNKALVHWLHDGNSISASQSFESLEYKRSEILRELQSEFARLQILCKLKQKNIYCSRALKNLIPLTQEVLEKREGELVAARDAIGSFKRDVIAEILKVARGLEATKAQSHIVASMTSRLSQLSLESLSVDGKIMWTRRSMRQLELELVTASQLDYSKFVTPLMRSCLQRHTYNLVKEDANGEANHIKSGVKEDANGEANHINSGVKEDANGEANHINSGVKAPKKKKNKKVLRTGEACRKTARNLIRASWSKAPTIEDQRFWQGRRVLYFLLACVVFAFISWSFHFNVHIF